MPDLHQSCDFIGYDFSIFHTFLIPLSLHMSCNFNYCQPSTINLLMASNNLDDLSNQINSVDDSEMPQWAKLLLKCFQGVITAVKEQKCDLCETHEININQLRLEVNPLNDEIKQFKKNK